MSYYPQMSMLDYQLRINTIDISNQFDVSGYYRLDDVSFSTTLRGGWDGDTVEVRVSASFHYYNSEYEGKRRLEDIIRDYVEEKVYDLDEEDDINRISFSFSIRAYGGL